MWWITLTHFLSFEYDKIGSLEGFTLGPFRQAKGAIRLTRDWFDFCVEHFSVYHRMFRVQNEDKNQTYDMLRQKMIDYVHKVDPYPQDSNLAPFSTIATIPFIMGNARRKLDGTERGDQLKVHALAATLASLAQFGIGRALVVGRNGNDMKGAQQAFDLLELFLPPTAQNKMEYRFVEANVNTTGFDDDGLVPKQATHGLKLAFLGKLNESVREEWLGPQPDRWKYVYFSEPDLILSSRPGSVSDLTSALNQGLMMAAHRLVPVPHQLDFPNLPNNEVLPLEGRFGLVQSVNSDDWVCCDAGNQFPGHQKMSVCGNWWYNCGFKPPGKPYETLEELEEAHRQKLHYLLLHFETGTSTVIMATTEHARQCVPLHTDACPNSFL